MSEYIKTGLKITWIILLVYWNIAAFFTRQEGSQEPFWTKLFQYWLPLVIAVLLLGPGEWFGRSFLRENFVPHTDQVGITGLSICVFGTFIACWSRYELGRNWSLSVQKKVDHELVQKGIYKLIRHPVYTGLLLMFIGHALIVGDYRGILAVIIVFISLWFKLKKEEKLLTETFGERYTVYKSNTKALIPFVI